MKESIESSIPKAPPDESNLGRDKEIHPVTKLGQSNPAILHNVSEFDTTNPEHVALYESRKAEVISTLLELAQKCEGRPAVDESGKNTTEMNHLLGVIGNVVSHFSPACTKMKEYEVSDMLQHIEIVANIGRRELVWVEFLVDNIHDDQLREKIAGSLEDLEKKISQSGRPNDYNFLLETIAGYADRLRSAVK